MCRCAVMCLAGWLQTDAAFGALPVSLLRSLAGEFVRPFAHSSLHLLVVMAEVDIQEQGLTGALRPASHPRPCRAQRGVSCWQRFPLLLSRRR
jgi:hypothetical protein